MIDFDAIRNRITEGCDRYEKTAPTVAAWLDDLYVRINEAADKVVLSELMLVQQLVDDGVWFDPNTAANRVYHLLHRLGRDTTGQAGF
jgi:hypothetical protein